MSIFSGRTLAGRKERDVAIDNLNQNGGKKRASTQEPHCYLGASGYSDKKVDVCIKTDILKRKIIQNRKEHCELM